MMMGMDLFRALRRSHEIQRTLCRGLLRCRREDSQELAFLQLKVELSAHAAAEERFLYVPLLMTDSGLSSSRHALAEHHEIEELCEALSVSDKSTRDWRRKAQQLSAEVHHHLKEEETKFFKVAGRILDDTQKSFLAKRYDRDLVRMRKSLSSAFAKIAVDSAGQLEPISERS